MPLGCLRDLGADLQHRGLDDLRARRREALREGGAVQRRFGLESHLARRVGAGLVQGFLQNFGQGLVHGLFRVSSGRKGIKWTLNPFGCTKPKPPLRGLAAAHTDGDFRDFTSHRNIVFSPR